MKNRPDYQPANATPAGIDKPMTAAQAAKEWSKQHPSPFANRRAKDRPEGWKPKHFVTP